MSHFDIALEVALEASIHDLALAWFEAIQDTGDTPLEVSTAE